jgi:hypothetical protein
MDLSRQPAWRDSVVAPDLVARQGGPHYSPRQLWSTTDTTMAWLAAPVHDGVIKRVRFTNTFFRISIKILFKKGLKIKNFRRKMGGRGVHKPPNHFLCMRKLHPYKKHCLL